MHMADALLAPAVAATMYAASATAAGVSIHKLKKDDEPSKLPVMAVTSALVFAGQMINYTIPGTGSSGHMCGGMMLSALPIRMAVTVLRTPCSDSFPDTCSTSLSEPEDGKQI